MIKLDEHLNALSGHCGERTFGTSAGPRSYEVDTNLETGNF